MLYWDFIVNHWVALFLHVLLEIVNYLQHLLDVRRFGFIALSGSLSSGIHLPDLLIALHASIGQGHAGPGIIALAREIGFLKL